MDTNFTKDQIKHDLKKKYILGTLSVIILVALAAIIVGTITFWSSIKAHYNSVAEQTAKTAAGYFTDEEIEQYARLVADFNHGAVSEDEIQKISESARYREVHEMMEKLRRSMNANDIFVNVMDVEVLRNFDQAAFEAKQWRPTYYIMDCYFDSELQFKMGDSGSINPDFREDLLNTTLNGTPFDRPIISKGDFGYNITACAPVIVNGKCIALVSAEIPMATLQKDILSFVINVLIVTFIIQTLLITSGVHFLIRYFIRPVETISDAAQRFVQNNAEISTELDKIQTKDEIQLLSSSVLKMEIDIKEYIENITKVTAEKERISAELNVATQIQADMLPSIFPAFPEREDFDIYATMTPAKEVGGDFYDFFMIDDDHIALVMADVSGKGVPAALFMVIAKTLIKNRVQRGDSPAEALCHVNEQLCEGNEAELFVTVWLAVLELSTGKGMAANAGHEHPVLRHKDGSFELVVYRHSPAVATMEGMRFKEHDFQMQPGDTLFVYTDGVPEATNANNELFGNDRMLNALNTDPNAKPQTLLENVKNAVDLFVGSAPQFDDLTMLGFTYYGPGGENKQ